MARNGLRTIRRGMTLVELLIVVAILVILVSAATAMMQVAGTDKETREAARQLNAMIAGCAARAAETGRPHGIWIERVANNLAREIFYAQAPPLYAGDNLTSAATITDTTVTCTFVTNFLGANGTPGDADDFIRPGDRIRFNYSGPWYPVDTVTSNTTLTITIGDKPAPVASNVPFQIRRGPRKSLAGPLQLPADTVVDLSQSGVDATELAAGTDAVGIMFNPQGSVDRVYFNGTSLALLGPLHLLIGRQGKAGTANLADVGNRWVSINPQTGTVITTENMGGVTVAAARLYAIQGKTMGGN